jgi:hypothetical protein
MPFDDSLIPRAARLAADSWLSRLKLRDSQVLFNTPKSALPSEPLRVKDAFVVGENGSMSEIEMVKCEHCEMWHVINRACECLMLPPSSLSNQKEPEFEAILEVPKVEYPFTCKNCGFQVLGPEHVCRVENRHKQ